MEASRVIICFAPEDREAAASARDGLEAAGFECRIPAAGGCSPAPGDFQWAGAMVVLLSSSAVGSDHVLRNLEEAASRGFRIVPVRLDGTPPSNALRYYLGPFQWVEPDREGRFLDRLVQALADGGIVPPGSGRTRMSGRTGTTIAVLTAGTVAAITLSRLFSGNEGGNAESSAVETVAAADSFDILIAGTCYTEDLPVYLTSLGYSLYMDTAQDLPDSGLERFDVILYCMRGDPETSLVLYDYLCSGGSVLLTDGQPYFLGMPDWLGMDTYSNYWGGDFPITAPIDSPLGIQGVHSGDILLYYTEFMDGGAVLKDPTTAEVDACFNGVDSLAAASRNTVGSGRVAWLSFIPAPFANSLGNGYSTDLYESYLAGLYAWLDRDGPEGTP